MLPPLILLAVAMRTRRRELKLTQRQLAASVGCSQSYVAQVERAHRPPSPWFAGRLEELFELEPGTYTNHHFLMGRPALTPQSKLVKRRLRAAVPVHPPYCRQFRRPRRRKSNVTYGLDNPFGAMKPGTNPGDALEKLERMRPLDERFWRQANALRYDSFTEKRFLLAAALKGAQLTGVGFRQIECQLQMVCGKTGKPYVRRAPAAFLWQADDLSIAWFPQRCVRSERGHRWPDHALVVAYQGRKMTVVLEINGPQWHKEGERERRRDRDLGVPVYHMCASQVENPEAIPRFLDWIRDQFRSA